jgi:hypothetical protein
MFFFVCLYLNVFLKATSLHHPQVFRHLTNFRGQGTVICVSILASKFFAQPPCWHILVSEKYAFIQVKSLPKNDRHHIGVKTANRVFGGGRVLPPHYLNQETDLDAQTPINLRACSFVVGFFERNTETIYSCRVFIQKTYGRRLAEGDRCEIQILLFRGAR